MIASISEVKSTIINLQKREKSNRRREFPNFRQYMSINYFKYFMVGVSYLFCEEKYQYIGKRDKLCNIFLPCINNYNEKRRSLIKIEFLIIDKSMLEWCSKILKLGSLLDDILALRKLISLGIMLKNCTQCYSNYIVYQDVTQSLEI